jgi:ABC-type antimicrobial peptide transport system permease subunit
VLVPDIRSTVRQLDSQLVLDNVATMEQRLSTSIARPRFYAALVGVFAVVAIALAAIGIYGVLAYAVSQCTREIGIRLALGARPAQIRTLVLAHGMQLLLIGSGIGVLGTLAISRSLQTVLFETSGLDPRIYLGVGAVLFTATLLASWLPARRASRVDPIVALRYE